VVHPNAPLTERGRLLLCRRIESGRPVAHVAAELGVSRQTAYRWWRRFQVAGEAGLVDRSSRPRRCPARTPARIERRICAERRRTKDGPARLGPRLGVAPSTVHRVLARHQLNRLERLDPLTAAPIRRYERARPGELVHVDVKKLGRLREGGGWRVHGRDSEAHRRRRRHGSRVGYDFLHSAVDDYTRLAYTEVLADETAASACAFWTRAQAFFASYGITVERVLSDNGPCYVSRRFNHLLAEQLIAHRRTRPYRPQTNGKVERYHATLAREWAYVRPYASNQARTRALRHFLHRYNHHRGHAALGGNPPVSRVTNLPGHHS
jgi:transposase InsO family protein